MLILSYKTQDINLTNDINDLLCQIDVKLMNTAKSKLDSDRFGAKICINKEDYNLLVKYRKYLYNKATGDCCLKDYLIDNIISRIKQLLNRN